MIEIKNLKLHQYTINTTIKENQNVGIYSRQDQLLKELLLIVAGINPSKNCFYYQKPLFDDETYFKERIYMDCEKEYINTLKANRIEEVLALKYHKVFHQEQFKKYVKDLRIRCEGTYQDEYKFTKVGNQLVNLCFGLCIFSLRLFYHPFSFLQDRKQYEYLKNEMRINRGNILALESLQKYQGVLDTLIILSNQQVYEFHDLNTRLLVVKGLIDSEFVIDDLELKNILLFKSIHQDAFIIRDELTKEKRKKLHQMKAEILSIPVLKLEEYL